MHQDIITRMGMIFSVIAGVWPWAIDPFNKKMGMIFSVIAGVGPWAIDPFNKKMAH